MKKKCRFKYYIHQYSITAACLGWTEGGSVLVLWYSKCCADLLRGNSKQLFNLIKLLIRLLSKWHFQKKGTFDTSLKLSYETHVSACWCFSAVHRCVFESGLTRAQHEHVYFQCSRTTWVNLSIKTVRLQAFTRMIWVEKCIQSGAFSQVAPHCHKCSHKHTPTPSKVFWVWKQKATSHS